MAPPFAHADLVFLVGIKNEPAGLQHFCFGGEGEVFVVASAFRSFILN